MKKTKLAVFASGSGSNYQAIAEACQDGRINAEIVLLVCDKPGAKVLERAKRYGTESYAFVPKEFESREAYESVIADMLDEAEKEAEYNELFANPYQAAKYGYIDDVIEPRNTRFRVIRALAQLESKRQGLPRKKHGNIPL